jgi:hypothetical protein
MESDKFITVCESGQIAIVDMSAGNTVTRQKITAEAAIMNPLSKVIALRGMIYFEILFLYNQIIIIFPSPIYVFLQPVKLSKYSTWNCARK